MVQSQERVQYNFCDSNENDQQVCSSEIVPETCPRKSRGSRQSSPPPAEEENRTIFLGVNSSDRESPEAAELVVVTDSAEFFRIGCSRRNMLDCSRDAKVVGVRGLLRFERGVEGAFVEVNVERDV